jgi:Flp pilus assembly protein TadB
MDKNDLRKQWLDAHTSDMENIYEKVDIQTSLRMNHSKSISKVLSDVKLKILLYFSLLLTFIGLMSYAFLYLGSSLSINSIMPLALAAMFLVIKTTSEIHRFKILTKTADNMSVKESLLLFRKKLNRIKRTDFLSYLLFFHLLVILIIINYLTDIVGIKNLSWRNEILPVPLLVIIILMLLLIPWFIKFQHNQRYKKLYSNLTESVNILDDEK